MNYSEREFTNLKRLYQQTRNPQILSQFIAMTQQFVGDERLTGYWDEALSKLKQLEQVTTLTPRLFYRKAVLLYNLGITAEAQTIFEELAL